ncbi:MAG: SurA N-terminal domain-containing protein [Thermodesulfovibrionales bacterium]|nr:SurA N-terminal domain-containing protein [Thermodesulfovibrionales bacterium]
MKTLPEKRVMPKKTPDISFRLFNPGSVLCALCFLLFALSSLLLAPCSSLSAEIKDRVVASIDNTAITLSDLEDKYAETVKVLPDITREEVLNTMVNRMLLVREGQKIRIEAPSEDELMKEYIDLKIRAFIRIKDEESSEYYNSHREAFGGKEFDEVREEIENYLTERELNDRLKLHLAELKKKTCIRIRFHEKQ